MRARDLTLRCTCATIGGCPPFRPPAPSSAIQPGGGNSRQDAHSNGHALVPQPRGRSPHHPYILALHTRNTLLTPSHPDSHRTESWAFVAPKKRDRPGSWFFVVLPSVRHSPFCPSAAICGRRHVQMSALASHTAARLLQRKRADPCRVRGSVWTVALTSSWSRLTHASAKASNIWHSLGARCGTGRKQSLNSGVDYTVPSLIGVARIGALWCPRAATHPGEKQPTPLLVPGPHTRTHTPVRV